MKDTNLKISSTFGKKFELNPNPLLTADKEALAEEIVKAIKGADKNTVQILRERGKKVSIIKDNIDKLSGYVFVKKEDDNKEFYFNSKFLDENEKLPCHLEEFRAKFVEKLKGEGIEFSKMKEYKFRIPNFVTCEEGQLDMKLSLPDDYIDDTDVLGFFESFVLSVNQPNEEELGYMIQEEIGEDFKLIDSDLMASKLQEDMLNWMKEKNGRFLTNDEGNELFKEIHQKVSKLVLIGPTLVYLAKIEQFQISFRDDLSELQDFLNSEHEQIFNLISSCDDTIFSSIKVLQTLKNLKCYQTEDSYIYMRLDSLLYIRERVMKAFGSRTSKLLAIECKAKINKAKINEVNLSKLYKQLSALLKMEKDKKIILITLKHDIFADEFKRDFSVNNHYTEIEDKTIDLTDLKVESQEKILTKGKVTFLGKEVTLNAVVDDESTHLLSGEVLSMLIKSEKLVLGEPPIDPKHIEVMDYFIDRTLTRYIMIKSDFMKDDNFLVFDDQNPNGTVVLFDYMKSKIESCSKSYTDIILISDCCNEFIKLCDKYRKHHSIHWLKKEKGVNERYIYKWKQSYGDLTKLRKFTDTSEQSVTKYTPNKITDVSDKVVLVAGEPGMGKSVLLSHLSMETQQSIPSPLWVVRSNLVDHSCEFSKWLETNTGTMEIRVLEAGKFLYKIIFGQDVYVSGDSAVDGTTEDVISLCLTQNEEDFVIDVGSNIMKNMTASSLLQIKLFAHFFNKGKVVLLFDGFDEISPHYNDLVVKLLVVLKDTKVKCVWLTTRPYNILREPENQFGTFAYALKPFLEKDQNNFLKKFWAKNVKLGKFDEMEVNVFIDALVKQFSKTTNDPDRKFTSIPLQICMLADTLSVEFKKSPEPFWKNKDALANKLDLVTLYEEFLENKLDIELRKIFSNDRDRKKPGALIDEKDKRSEFMISHEILGVCSVFRVDQCKKVLSAGELEKVKELKELISEAGKKTGVIVNIVDDEPKFIHHTFAEYFAARFVWKKFISNVELKEFEEKIVRDIVIEMLIKDDAIQVSKFLQLIAKRYFNGGIGFSTWKSNIEILLMELTNKIKDFNPWRDDNSQSIKLLLGIIEFFLQKQEEQIYPKIIENQSTKLLRVCAELGYTKLARALTSLNTKLLKQDLSQRIWFDSPLWFAAKNGHLDIMRFLVERFSYDTKWQDVAGEFLMGCILGKSTYRYVPMSAFDVLKYCLELNIIDGRPFKDHENAEHLPIELAIEQRAPAELIKLMIENTDANIVNVFIHNDDKLPVSNFMLRLLLNKSEYTQYDKHMEIIELALKKGIDFSFCLNDVLFELIKYICDSHWLDGGPTYVGSFFYHSYPLHACHLFPIIEQLFKAGVGYSYIDARPRGGCQNPPSDSTYCIAKRVNSMYKLLYEIYNLHKQNDKENDDPTQVFFRLILDYIRYLGFEAVEIIIKLEEILIVPHYREECNHKFHILILIFTVIQKSMYFKHLKCSLKPCNNPNTISIMSVQGWTIQDGGCFPRFKCVTTALFFKNYIEGNSNSDLVKSAVDELKKRALLAEKSGLPITFNFSYYFACLRAIRNNSEIPDNVDEENEHRNEPLNVWVRQLVGDVSELCRKDYEITDALEEILKTVIKLEEVFNKLLEMKKKSSSEHNVILDEDQILDFLGLKNIACEREDLQKLVLEISDTTTSFNDFVDILYELDHFGQRNVIRGLEQILQFSDQSKQIFDLFKELHEGYENVICAVQEDDIDKVRSALQNIKQHFVKATINGQDEDYGSPLHYAALNGQVEIMNVFLDHGANPNLRLCNNFEKITHFSRAVEKMKMGPFPSEDFINWTPLYFAVLNNHEQAVQNLIERGADVNHVLNPGRSGYSPLHISALSCGSMKIARLLLKNGACYNVPNKEGKTPLNLATSGSDFEKLLRSIDELFQIVEQGETNAVNSVFEALDFDSWEAVLSAKNIDDETLLKFTESNGQEDIFELLEERLRFVECRRL